MFKLEILYDSGSTEIKRFKTREEAVTYARMEGDHVWQYKVTEEKNKHD